MVAVQLRRFSPEGKAEMEGVGESIRVISSDWSLWGALVWALLGGWGVGVGDRGQIPFGDTLGILTTRGWGKL